MSGVGSQFDFVDTPGDIRPFAFRLPRPTSTQFLAWVGRNCDQAIDAGGQPLHVIAVANSAIPIATAMLLHRQGRAKDRQLDDYLSIVDPNRLEYIDRLPRSGALTILVDNSIKSVQTISKVYHKLLTYSVNVRYVLKLVDYQDEVERDLATFLNLNYNMTVLNVFSARDLAESNGYEAARLVRQYLKT